MVRRSQISHTPQHIEFLSTEAITIGIGVEDLIPLVGGQVAQLTVGLTDPALTVLRHGLVTLEKSLRLLLLRRSEVFERLHSIQDLGFLVGRQIVKMMQAVDELLLLLWREITKAGILPKLLLLLRHRLVPVLAQPIAAMRPRAVQMELASSLGVRVAGWRRIIPVLLPARVGEAIQRP